MIYSCWVTGNLSVSLAHKRVYSSSLEVHVLAGKRPVNRGKGVQLVLELVLFFGVEVAGRKQCSSSIARRSLRPQRGDVGR